MPSATASGSDAGGSQDRKYTPEQKAAVLRIRKCSGTAFYEILSLEKTATDSEIKKAYRKLSLVTHPDKNGYEGADEAFKMVSRAFQILSDSEKRSRYDKFGGDPDSRFQPSGGPAGASPFAGGFGGGFPRGGTTFDDEISPEELFNRFFNGGLGGGFGPFGGPQFVFNMGGGPGFRVHQFGGPRPRRRPRDDAESEPTPSAAAMIRQLLPLILLFLLPLLSSLFSGGPMPSGPSYRYDPIPPHTQQRTTPEIKIDYFLNPKDVTDFNSREFRNLDKQVEVDYVKKLRFECEGEIMARDRMVQDAQGWFFPDVEKMKVARSMELKSCRRLDTLPTKRRY